MLEPSIQRDIRFRTIYQNHETQNVICKISPIIRVRVHDPLADFEWFVD